MKLWEWRREHKNWQLARKTNSTGKTWREWGFDVQLWEERRELLSRLEQIEQSLSRIIEAAADLAFLADDWDIFRSETKELNTAIEDARNVLGAK